MRREEIKNILEPIIDKVGLHEVREAIIDICFEKEAHVRENWPNDTGLANAWMRLGEAYVELRCLLTDSVRRLEDQGYF